MSNKAKCYWITGLSGSGKTTLAFRLKTKMQNVVLLDGDVIRDIFDVGDSYDSKSRLKIAYIYAKMAKMLVENQINVICSTISLFHEIHDWNRANIPGYVEIFLDFDISELERRDSKSIYSRAKKGQLKNVVGYDIKPEYPKNPEFRIQSIKEIESFMDLL